MYYLPLKINNRKYHHAPLRPVDVESASSYVPSFILVHEPGQERQLFSLLLNTRVTYRGGFSRDRYIDWAKLTADLNESELVLHVATTEQKPEADSLPTLADPPEGIQFRLTEDHVALGITRHYARLSLTVTLSVAVDGSVHQSQFQLHLAPQTFIHDVVMDFGSEASQIVTYRRGRGSVNKRMKLVDNLLNYYYTDLKGKDLHQRDSQHDDLYRSAYFIRKEDAVFDPNACPGLHGDQELLNLLTDKDQKNKLAQDRVLVSNLKLAHLGAYNFLVRFASRESNAFRVEQRNFIDTIVRLQQAVVNYFMQVVLEEIRRSTPTGQPIYLAVKLLVPNVFEQNKVSRLIRDTALGLQEMARQQPEYQLAGAEISTISESDAAFLGFKKIRQDEENLLREGGRYLIIDVGKGTTDFSILEINAQSAQLASLYRSGFIGAGNVLSYAFVDTIFTAICGQDSALRQRAIQAVTQRADIVEKLQFTEIIEKLKRDYKATQPYKSLGEVVDLTTIRGQLFEKNEAALASLVTLLEQVWQQQGSIRDEWGIINRTVNEVANRIHREVVQSGRYADPKNGRVLVEKIIITGRGFLFEPLQSAIRKAFDVPIERTADMKQVCLTGAFSSDHINFDSNLVGFPEVYQLFGCKGQQSKQIDTGDGKILDIPIVNPLFSWVQQKGASIQKGFALVSKFGEGHQIQQSEMPTDADIHPGERYDLSKEEQFLNYGQTFPQFNRNAKVIAICGLDYKQHQIDSSTVNVFFTGEDFIIRDAQSFSLLQVEPDFFRNNQRVFQTLYPFLDIPRAGDVSVTPLTDDDF